MQVAAKVMEEVGLKRVIGPCTIEEAACYCGCTPEELRAGNQTFAFVDAPKNRRISGLHPPPGPP